MIRLIIYATLLAVGGYAGAEYARYELMQACLDAGGSVDARGFCKGVE
ncbi:hypothetical protein [Poseidonocella sp. HB161398]|nr:hypothetical protein [Poseidonocella sp. HB161398]